jgi:SAM-dependent MidA family methyltransferase
MASSDLDQPAPFPEVFKATLGARNAMPFAEFMKMALYHPECGYYRSNRTRVGRSPEADFYTSESLGRVLSDLVAAAAVHLLTGVDPGSHVFVEIGAEPGSGLHPDAFEAFREFRPIRLGDNTRIPEKAVVFSNELYDAQPFHRVVYRNGRWTENGVGLDGEELTWVDLGSLSPQVVAFMDHLPVTAVEGTVVDLPIAATEMMAAQVEPDWTGLFIAADYGKSWTALVDDSPHGTGRAYRHHKQHGDLLANPGRQDLTCHICWDWMETVLKQHGFAGVQVTSQEAFFIRNAPDAIKSIITDSAGPLSERHSQLKTLIHPGLMGQKFQVLTGRRSRHAG